MEINMIGGAMNHRIMIYGRALPPKVNPGRKEVCPGDTITFEARGTDATVMFPPAPKWPFCQDWEPITVYQENLREPQRRIYTVKDINEESDLEEFPYAVFCSSPNCFAVGTSDPIIIIRRPS
jgi:hypothetical protein